ncbi:ATP-binding protein [Nonomuraea sp. NPDC000554]|uniref:ATP-binding protein n=1 Tax=Nonomuraea sp. NPDC000554 TaxID=3154259 RepID=UPI003327FCD5
MTVLRSVPRSRRQQAWALDGDPQAIGHARKIIRAALNGLGLRPDLVDDAVLMVSELVTNAFLYGEAPYELLLQSDDDEILCVVVDSGALLPVPRTADDDAERGRGLRIVAALSDGFHGCHPQRYVTRPDLTGKATWFALPR